MFEFLPKLLLFFLAGPLHLCLVLENLSRNQTNLPHPSVKAGGRYHTLQMYIYVAQLEA